MSIDEIKRAVQSKLGLHVDGIDGMETWTAIYKQICGEVPLTPSAPRIDALVPAGPLTITLSAARLILDAEGVDQPWKWPGLDSGISLGPGVDLSSESAAELEVWFQDILTTDQIARLKLVVGKSGETAHALAHHFSDITITKSQSDHVFYTFVLPKYGAITKRAFSGVEKLPPALQGALLSCVYNRGPAMEDSGPPENRRLEMRIIHGLVADFAAGQLDQASAIKGIAKNLESMARLWRDDPRSNDDIHDRRYKEADLASSALA